MKTPAYTSIAVCIIFFFGAFIEALRAGRWLLVVVFVALGLLALWADVRNR